MKYYLVTFLIGFTVNATLTRVQSGNYTDIIYPIAILAVLLLGVIITNILEQYETT
jgi:hypothetical protein